MGALSLATDAAAGFAPETAVRTSVIAVRLGRAAGLSPDELRDCYYAGLLRYLGCTGYAHEVSEMALAHSIESKVERAYRRGDLFEKRRRLMDDWATYCASNGAAGATVTPIRTAMTG